jgi:hypothetical protein
MDEIVKPACVLTNNSISVTMLLVLCLRFKCGSEKAGINEHAGAREVDKIVLFF